MKVEVEGWSESQSLQNKLYPTKMKACHLSRTVCDIPITEPGTRVSRTPRNSKKSANIWVI